MAYERSGGIWREKLRQTEASCIYPITAHPVPEVGAEIGVQELHLYPLREWQELSC